jgi:hypothetical protein
MFPPPLIGFPGIEEYQMAQIGGGRLGDDCEAPGLQPIFFERMLARLARSAPRNGDHRSASVLVFSGDVHFGHTARLRYSSTAVFGDPQAGVTSDLVVVQMTSSAAKNAVDADGSPTDLLKATGLRFVGGPGSVVAGVPMPGFGVVSTRTYFGYANAALFNAAMKAVYRTAKLSEQTQKGFYRLLETRRVLEPSPGEVVDVTGIDAGTRVALAEEWKYRIEYLQDVRYPVERTGPLVRGREAVPDTNVGVVSFEGDSVRVDLRWSPWPGLPAVAATSILVPLAFDEV